LSARQTAGFATFSVPTLVAAAGLHVRCRWKSLISDRKMDDRKIAQWSEDDFSVIHLSVIKRFPIALRISDFWLCTLPYSLARA
jgi:hypothetical protein